MSERITTKNKETDDLPVYLRPYEAGAKDNRLSLRKAIKKLTMPALATLAALYFIPDEHQFAPNKSQQSSDQASYQESEKLKTSQDRIEERIENYIKYPQVSFNRIQKERLLHAQSLNDIYGLITHFVDIKFLKNPRYSARALQDFENEATKQKWLLDFAQAFEFKRIPKGVRDLLLSALPGLPAQEGKLDDFAYNSGSGATGTFQITDLAMTDILKRLPQELRQNFLSRQNSKNDLRYNYKFAAYFALLHFDRNLYPRMKKSLKRLSDMLAMHEKDFNQFSTLALLNSYNTGAGAIDEALKHFIAYLQKAKEDAVIAGDKSKEWRYFRYLSSAPAMELFMLFTKLAKKHKWHKTYGVQAQEYVWLVLAGAESALKLGSVPEYDKKLEIAESNMNLHNFIAKLENTSGYWWRTEAQLE